MVCSERRLKRTTADKSLFIFSSQNITVKNNNLALLIIFHAHNLSGRFHHTNWCGVAPAPASALRVSVNNARFAAGLVCNSPRCKFCRLTAHVLAHMAFTLCIAGYLYFGRNVFVLSNKCLKLQAGYFFVSKIRLLSALSLYLTWGAPRPLVSVIRWPEGLRQGRGDFAQENRAPGRNKTRKRPVFIRFIHSRDIFRLLFQT